MQICIQKRTSTDDFIRTAATANWWNDNDNDNDNVGEATIQPLSMFLQTGFNHAHYENELFNNEETLM